MELGENARAFVAAAEGGCDEKVRKSNNRNFTFDSRLVYSFIQHVATKVTVGQRGMYQKNMTFREIKV